MTPFREKRIFSRWNRILNSELQWVLIHSVLWMYLRKEKNTKLILSLWHRFRLNKNSSNWLLFFFPQMNIHLPWVRMWCIKFSWVVACYHRYKTDQNKLVVSHTKSYRTIYSVSAVLRKNIKYSYVQKNRSV